MTARSDAFDDALDRLTGYDYLDGVGFACHGPMGAEALSSLGHNDRVGSWVEAYKQAHPPIAAPPPGDRLDPHEETSWRPALGDFARVSDWENLFRREVREHHWQDVLRDWVPRLMPGYPGGLTHGLIRSVHAVRALADQENPSELAVDELARGLASWAGFFKALPERRPKGSLSLPEAVRRLPRPDDVWTPVEAGMFARIGEVASFADSVEALAPPNGANVANGADGLSDLTAAFCQTILDYPEAEPTALVHMVTPIALTRSLMPYLPQTPADELYARMWQVGAAIIVGFLPQRTSESRPVDAADVPSVDEVIGRAVEQNDPHVIKFVEACMREDGIRPNPIYMHAAQQVIDHGRVAGAGESAAG